MWRSFPRLVLVFEDSVLENINVHISKKRAYFVLKIALFRDLSVKTEALNLWPAAPNFVVVGGFEIWPVA